MASRANILAWKISWTEKPGRLQSMGSQRVGHDWVIEHTHTRIEIDTFAHSLPCDFAVPQLGWVKYVSDPSDAMLGHAYAEQLTECSMTDDKYDNGLLWQNCPGDDKAWITEFAAHCCSRPRRRPLWIVVGEGWTGDRGGGGGGGGRARARCVFFLNPCPNL